MRNRVVVFDIESSGLNVETERIVSLSARVTRDDGSTETFSRLVNPGVLIPASASRVNNIYDETVSGADSFNVVGAAFLQWVHTHAGDSPVLCAFNGIKFDFQMLYYELRRHCEPEDVPDFTKLECVDPYVMARALIPPTEICNYKQTTVYEHLFGEQPSGAHSSLGDTEALDRIINHELFAPELAQYMKRMKNLKRFLQ